MEHCYHHNAVSDLAAQYLPQHRSKRQCRALEGLGLVWGQRSPNKIVAEVEMSPLVAHTLEGVVRAHLVEPPRHVPNLFLEFALDCLLGCLARLHTTCWEMPTLGSSLSATCC